jgi:hypothetical protein
MGKPLRDIISGGAVDVQTDQIVAVRDGAQDVLIVLGKAAEMAVSNNNSTIVASVVGNTPVGNIAVFSDTNGSITGGGALAPVALSGAYADLSGKPTLGSAAALTAGAANGVATLDSGGKVPLTQIPASIVNGLEFKGLWNASTNNPTLVSSVGETGDIYKVSVSGSTNLNGISDWLAGDLVMFDGSVWGKVDGVASEVLSVAGRTGNVVLSTADISGLGSAATQSSSAFATAAQGVKADAALPAASAAAVATTGQYNDLLGRPAILTLNAVNAFTAQQYFAQATITYAGTISWDLNTQQAGRLTATGNFTLNAINMQAGSTYVLTIVQDATGSRVITWGSMFKFPGGFKPVLSLGANAVDVFSFVSDGTNMIGGSGLLNVS